MFELINEVLGRPNLISKAKRILCENALRMIGECEINVPDYVQQLEKLRFLFR
jgi:hypothetical protein